MSRSDWQGIYLLFRNAEFSELEKEAKVHGYPLFRYLHILIDSGRTAYNSQFDYTNLPDFDSVFTRADEE